MPKPKALTPTEAGKTLAARFVPVADNLRQLATSFGIRPYRVFLVWTKYTGSERGEGSESEYKRIEILPTPRVKSLDSLALSPTMAGILPMGSLKIDRVSGTFTEDMLKGTKIWGTEESVPEPYSFFYEVVEDGRGDVQPRRKKFRLASDPHRDAGNVSWQFTLERESEDRARDGTSRLGPGK